MKSWKIPCFPRVLGFLCGSPCPCSAGWGQASWLPPLLPWSGRKSPQHGNRRQRHRVLAWWHDSPQQNQLLAWIWEVFTLYPSQADLNLSRKPGAACGWAASALPRRQPQQALRLEPPLNPIRHHSQALEPSRNTPESLPSCCPPYQPHEETDRPAQPQGGACTSRVPQGCSGSANYCRPQVRPQGQASRQPVTLGGAEFAGTIAFFLLTHQAVGIATHPNLAGPPAGGVPTSLGAFAGCWTPSKSHMNRGQLSESVYHVRAFTRFK